ncbi:Thiol:disulfide interchange protein DsbD [Meiothermus luteus]|jgi:thioredoxin-related protein|uniref:Thiol:disulfide interchange protein DsbD n=1 Tax=Meiothermus luteus TaxID=2026184 RepID=A0A399ETP7_9DEIN|nr:thioredoxin fold domain-containing protein [Meiothermus luteus]RIH85952.1 Thiol:disulfide interchange protein DsbD [Meiothermus luteus]RMH54613.1 MAG: thioredoxin [Deinococcota bacterium]
MRIVTLLALGGFLASAAAGPAVDFDRWYPYPQAQQYAQAHQRILMVYFWSHGCPYCEQMNTFVLSDDRISRTLARRYVVASVDMHSPEGQALSRQMRAFGTPTFVFLVPQEGTWKEIGRLFGSRPRAQFLRELEQVCAKAGGEACE